MPIDLLVSGVSLVFDVLINSNKLKRNFNKKDFLNYDQKYLISKYSSEKSISKDVPYLELIKFNNIKNINEEVVIECQKHKFKLENDHNTDISAFQSKALNAFQSKMNHDGNIVRLNSVKKIKNKFILQIQFAKYSDQVRSNLVLDWVGHKIKNFPTLREYLLIKRPSKLPPLNSKLLANTIGISCILYYKKNGNLIPYLPQRAIKGKGPFKNEKKDLAVFVAGETTVTASGALEFPSDLNEKATITFDKLFEEDMFRELYEEVGIAKSDVMELIPLALCREYLRAGKPQIFFTGILKDGINEKDLNVRRRMAIKRAKNNMNEKIEIQENVDYAFDLNSIVSNCNSKGITLEALANLFYCELYFNSGKPH